MKITGSFLLGFILFSTIHTHSQNTNIEYEEKFMYDNIGYSIFRPQFKRGYETRGDWQGITGGVGEFDLGYFSGNVFKKNELSDTGFMNTGWMVRAGYRFDFSKKKKRPLSLGQFRIIPMLTVNMLVARAGGHSERNYQPYSYGFNASPGLRLKASIFNIEYRPELNFVYPTSSESALRWFYVSQMLTIGIDGIFDVFTPKNVFEKIDYMKRKVTKVETFYSSRYEKIYDWYTGRYIGIGKVGRTTRVEHYKYVPATMKFNLYLTKPFITATPLVEYFAGNQFRAETKQLGAQLNGLLGFWKFGTFAKIGEIGTKSPYDRESMRTLFPDIRNMNFGASIPTQTAGISIGYNPMQSYNYRLIGNNLNYMVNYHRLFLTGQFVYTRFDIANASYADPNAINHYENIADRFSEVKRNTTDIGLLPETAMGWAYGANLEMGAASVSLIHTMYPKAKMANYTSLRFEMNIPYSKLTRTLNAIRKIKKIEKESKKAKS